MVQHNDEVTPEQESVKTIIRYLMSLERFFGFSQALVHANTLNNLYGKLGRKEHPNF